ncbi:MAG TPA: hypothetical protein VK327_15290 [Candidatus Paceibacterota bacterium]|nr:hypothetical protein [Candidatus Paceibacterota bacterium]
MRLPFIALISLLVVSTSSVHAWDYEGHRVINQLAFSALPTNFPSFAKAAEARERIAFLAGEPDRWRNISDDQSLPHCNNPDHYIDLEQLGEYGLTPETLPPLRYDFAAKLAVERALHPEKFAPIDPMKNKDHTRQLIGFVPWSMAECVGKLRSGFSYLKAYQNYGGTPQEIANAEANIIYIMGVMGHYVGDGAQPLHVTVHHHGWVGPNPNGYATNSGFHGWIDGGFFRKSGGIDVPALSGKLRPAKIVGDPFQSGDLFKQLIGYVGETEKRVEPLYKLEKEHKLTPENPSSAEGRAFLNEQLVRGGQMLGDLWFSAWQQATEDRFLIDQLKQRQAREAK